MKDLDQGQRTNEISTSFCLSNPLPDKLKLDAGENAGCRLDEPKLKIGEHLALPFPTGEVDSRDFNG